MMLSLLLASLTQVIDLQGAEAFAAGQFDGTALTHDGRVVTALSFVESSKVEGSVLRAWPDGSHLLAAPLRWIDAKGATIIEDSSRSFGDACSGSGGAYLAASPGGLLRFRRSARAAWSVIALPRSHRSLHALQCTKDGALLAAGQPAALYRLSGGKVRSEISVPGDALRSILETPKGVVAGALNDGRVWLWNNDSLRVLFVAEHPEVRRLLLDAEKNLVVLSVAAESGDSKADHPIATPISSGSGAVQRHLKDSGSIETLWTGNDETPVDLTLQGKRLWLASDNGSLYRLNSRAGDGDARRQSWRSSTGDERPIEALVISGQTLLVFGGGLVRSSTNGKHRYRSPRLTSGGVMANWGSLRVDSNQVAGLRWRFGNDPNGEGWGPWQRQPGGRALFTQVELLLKPGASINRLQQFLRVDNRAPQINSFLMLDQGTRIEPKPLNLDWDKSFDVDDAELKDFVAQTLRWDRPAAGKSQARVHWSPGYRSIVWQAKDSDDDALWYRVELLVLGADKVSSVRSWEQGLSFYSIKTSALAQGSYQLRVAVRDGESSWSAAKASPIFQVDHQAPTIKLLNFERRGKVLRLRVSDNDRVVAVRCGSHSERVALQPADGVADSRQELFVMPSQTWLKPLRLKRCEAIDAAGNRGSLDLP
jgi:hypothetical protein